MRTHVVRLISIALVSLAHAADPYAYEPQPGDVFTEHKWPRRDKAQLIFGNKLLGKHRQFTTHKLDVPRVWSIELDPANARKVDLVCEYWSGHIGTSEKSIILNPTDAQLAKRKQIRSITELDANHVLFPLPRNTPQDPHRYFVKMRQQAVNVPLDFLRNGNNRFTFWAGKQVYKSFHYPAFSVGALVFRVYQKDSAGAVKGRIVNPRSNGLIGPDQVIEANVADPAQVAKVEFFAEYSGYGWDGDGVAHKWHYAYTRGKLTRHVGTATQAPFRVTWDNEWLPDQTSPIRLKAHITSKQGSTYVTDIVGGLRLKRDYAVKMCGMPEPQVRFKSRAGQMLNVNIPVPDALDRAREARLVVIVGAPHDEDGELGFNGAPLITVPHNSKKTFYEIPVQADRLRKGDNEFSILSHTRGHAMEIYHPGPALLVKFRR